MQFSSIRCSVFVASLLLASVHLALAQLQPMSTPTPPPQITPAPTPDVNPHDLIPVVIHYGEGQEARARIYQGVMEPIGLLASQIVTVTILLPPNRAGQPVLAGLYDGGQVGLVGSPADNISINDPGIPLPNVSADGTVQFNFQAAQTLGLYRLLMTIGPRQYLLQFYAGRPRDAAIPGPNDTVLPTPPPSPPPSPTPN